MHLATTLVVSVAAAVSALSLTPRSTPTSLSTVTGRAHLVVGVIGQTTTLNRPTHWPAHARVSLTGSLRIAAGGALDIGAGSIIEAAPGVTIVIERGGRLNVTGTQNEPVVLTCQSEASTPGCWGGLVILGNAPINHGASTSPAGGRGGTGGCREATLDGGLYGGCTADDSSGVLRYARIQYATHGLRVLGVGSRTVLRDVQVHRSQGHGLEVIGGTAQLQYVALTTNAQYGLLYSGGWTGRAQYVVVQQDATGYAGGIFGRNAVGSGGNADATPRSAPILANVTVITPPSAPGNPYGAASPASLRFDRGAAGRLHNILLIEPAIALDVDGAASCSQIVAGLLTIQGLGITAPVQLTDPDADAAECATQGEPFLMSTAITVTGTDARAQLKAAIDVVLPDLRAVTGSVIALATGVAPPPVGLLEPVTYLGAIAPASLSGEGIPWYSGWTLGEQLAPPPLVTLDGVVSAPGRGGVAGVGVHIEPVGLNATTDALGRFVVAGVPAGPVEVSFVSGVPADCQTPAVVRAVASGTSTHLADAVLTCAPPAPILVARSLVSGSFHTCGLTNAGVAYCWGVNSSGQLGDGSTVQRSAPVLVSGGNSFVSLTAGPLHTCALTSAGAAFCWGSNSFSEIGDGTTTVRTLPTPVSGGFTFATLAAGQSHTCGLTTTSLAYCWGRNFEGQIGDGTSAQSRPAPTPVLGGQTFTALTAGQLHTCGLTSAGAALCWGWNVFGQLGDGSTRNQLAPAAVTGSQVFTALTAGTYHTCGVSNAGVAFCWGANNYGEVGDGSTARRTSPTRVSGARAFTSLAALGQHTCGLTSLGVAFCWGRNIEAQLGVGPGNPLPTTVPTRVITTQRLIALAPGETHTCALTGSGAAFCWGSNLNGQLGDAGTQRTTPAAVAGAQTFATVSAGSQHSCGLTSSGVAFCWGTNGNGQLGDGTQLERGAPTVVVGGIAFAKVSAGAQHTCGLTSAGSAYCWGSNQFGQIGDGTTSTRFTPVQVAGGVVFNALNAGGSHTCALTAAGAAYCWGLNSNGQIGDGTSVPRVTPTLVVGSTQFVKLALSPNAGSSHTCGLTNAGVTYCWGYNALGQLGDGSTVDRFVPTVVSGAMNFADLTTGGAHTCAINAAGAASCWGSNILGQLGDGSTANRPIPTAVVGGRVFSELAANAQTCGRTSAGETFCWGSNGNGQVGDGSTTNRSVPTPVGGGQLFTSLAAGQQHTCAVSSTSTTLCWGSNLQSQLGLNLPPIRAVAGGIAFRVP
jgi:alpha-tubulin suppressor-like RCC1 family protein